MFLKMTAVVCVLAMPLAAQLKVLPNTDEAKVPMPSKAVPLAFRAARPCWIGQRHRPETTVS